MIKAAFFDVDGTLVSFKTHKIVDSARKAIKKLREKGIKVFVASGRAMFQMDNLDNLEFDGYITVNGCCCFVNEDHNLKEIYSVPLDKNDLFALVEYLSNNKFHCRIVTRNDMFINYTDSIINMFYAMSKAQVPKIIDFKEYITRNYEQILQLNVFIDENKEKYLMSNILKNSKSSRWHFSSADVNSKEGGKEVGIDKIIEYFGIDLSETIAFGDGGNDISMIEHVGIGVAMGNAQKSVKKVAKYVTDKVDNDGVYKALKHFNLIE